MTAEITLEKIFPKISTGFNNIGFLFGSGTSKEAGYPLATELTEQVYKSLEKEIQEGIKKFLVKKGLPIDLKKLPDIEVLSDLILKDRLATGDKVLEKIEDEIRKKIIEIIDSISKPDLRHHIKFLLALKKICENKDINIWIFTTNYDVAFEMAAMEAEITIDNGFVGVGYRYLDIEKLNLSYGIIDKRENKFESKKEPKIKLIKLHGSISWYERDSKIFEFFGVYPNAESFKRLMILPKKEKIFESMGNPYDMLFRYAKNILGDECLYLVSCGFSYRDQHINNQIIFPKLKQNKIDLLSFFENEPENIADLKKYNSFRYFTKDKYYEKKIEESFVSDCWKFSKLSDLMYNKIWGVKK